MMTILGSSDVTPLHFIIDVDCVDEILSDIMFLQ